jgi:hypothetical protein
LKYYHPERLEKLMNKYRQAALLIQRSKFKNMIYYLIRIFLGLRGYMARKQFKHLKLTSRACETEVHQFCVNIEEINNQLIHSLTQLDDKLPGSDK